MIELYSTSVTVPSGGQIPFNRVVTSKGASVLRSTAGSVQVMRPGWYRVDITASAVAGATGDISIQLYKDDEPLAYAVTTESATSTTAVHDLSISAVVKITKCCQCENDLPVLTVYNAGVEATYNMINAIFTRIG